MADSDRTEDHILFFSRDISAGRLHLDQGETRHLRSVLRIETGDEIFVTDGQGQIHRCEVEVLDKRSCTARIMETREQARVRPLLHLHIGMPDKNPFEEVLSTLIPFGVESIVPLACEYCQRPWWDKRWDKRRDRFRRKMVAAAKQSWNPHLPELADPIGFRDALAGCPRPVVYADPDGVHVDALGQQYGDAEKVSCFVGPPGGFSPGEVEALREVEARSLWLSPYRLRTEHAVSAMAAVMVQEFGAEG
jgi:16S rRNA (uracil1498-N3)-methyltransferase